MNYRLSSLMAIAGLILVLFIPNAHSDFASNNKYLIQANGYVSSTQDILDSTFVLQITSGAQSGTNMLANLDNGLVTIGGIDYLSTGSWQTTILRNGNFLLLQGNAQDQNGNIINLNLFGRLVTSNQGGTVYSITGKITGAQTFKVIYSAKVTLAGMTTIPQATQTPSGTTTPTSQNQPQSNVVTISIVPYAHEQYNPQQRYFSPSVVNVSPGTTIVWTNNDTVSHRIESGTASAQIGSNAAPIFTPDGMIDSGTILPGQSFQYTVTDFSQREYISDAAVKYLGLDPHQTYRDITFYDPNYTFMQGAIGPLTPAFTNTSTAQITILEGASTATNAKLLSPQTIQVTPGSTVIFSNSDSVSHKFLSGMLRPYTAGGKGAGSTDLLVPPAFTPDGIMDTGMIAPHQTYTFTLKSSTGTLNYYDPANTWLNGIIISSSANYTMPPVQISILPGSHLSQATASQSNQQYYNQYLSITDIEIIPGTAIVWTNNDNIAHQIWSGVNTQSNVNQWKPDGKIQSPLIPPGASFEVIINDTGMTRFYDPGYNWVNGLIVSIPSVSGQKNIGAYYKNANPFLH